MHQTLNPELSQSKSTSMYDSSRQLWQKQSELYDLMEQRNALDWIGKKHSMMSSHRQKKSNSPLVALNEDSSKVKNHNRKNQSEHIAHHEKYIQLNTLYGSTFDLKRGKKEKICSPLNHFGFSKAFEEPHSIYGDSFKTKGYAQPQKPIKRLEEKFDLPFLGKSSYKGDYNCYNKAQKTNLIRPRNSLRTLDIDIKTANGDVDQEKKVSTQKNVRPPSPVMPRNHLSKSKSFLSGYESVYKQQFREEGSTSDELIRQMNLQNMRKSKFGSLGKGRWIKSKRLSETKFSNLSLYL